MDIAGRNIESKWKFRLGTLHGELQDLVPEDMIQYRKEENGGGKTEIWTGHPAYGQDFQVKVVWEEKEDRLYAGRISYSGYKGALFIEEIHFPIVTYPRCKDSGFLWGGSDMGLIVNPAMLNEKAWEETYCSMQFAAFLNGKEPGIYFDHRDTRHSSKSGRYQITETEQIYSCIHFIGNSETPAKEYALPYENCIGVFQGGWFEAGQIYKKWALRQSWAVNRRHENPLRHIGMWVWNRGLAEEVIPPVLKLQEDSGSIPVALDWYWWHHNPYDTDYPDFWPPREGEEKFKADVAELRKHGIFTQVYVNGMTWDMDGASWKEGGDESIVILRDGNPRAVAFNQFNYHRLGYMCGESPKFQDKMSVLVRRLRESGLDGQYLDMIGCASYTPCYNPAHHHPRGDSAAGVEGFRNMLTRLKAENPGFPLSTECSNEAYMDLVDSVITCGTVSAERMGSNMEFVPLFTSIYHGSLAVFGSYALPDGIPSWDPLWPDKERWQGEEPWHRLYPDQFFIELARDVAWGVQPMVCNLSRKIQEDPEFREPYRFILETAKFYHANRKFLFDGAMLSPEGFQCGEKEVKFMKRMIFTKKKDCAVIVKTLPVILHSIWKAPDGEKALILANYTGCEQEWSYQKQSGKIPAHSYRKITLP